MAHRNAIFGMIVTLGLAAQSTAQTCNGPQTNLPTIGQVTNPPAASAPINVSYAGQFKVPRTGVYHLQGSVSLGMGSGALVTFTSVKAVVVGHTVIDEAPPPIQSSPPNQWSWHWSIYYVQISKAWEHRVYLIADTTYSFSIEAKGSTQVVTPYHRRNYGVSMNGTATYCGPQASVTSVGTGCVGSSTPNLQSTLTPVLGQRRDLVVTGRANALGAVVFGIPATSPLYFGAGCNIYVDLGLPSVLVPVATGSTGVGFVVFTIPDNPALSSARIGTQAVLANAASPVGLDLSQSLVLTLGY